MIRLFRQAAGPEDLHSLVPAGDSLGRNLLRGPLPVSVVVFAGKPIRIVPSGGKIKPEQSNVRVPSSPRVPDIAIITAAAETLQDDLDRAFG